MRFWAKKYFALILTALLPCLLCPLSGWGAIANVSVVNDAFSPSTSHINAGDTVIWTWASGAASHNVVSTSTPFAWLFPNSGGTTTNQNDSNLKSAPFGFTNTFTSAGSFPYECTEHVSLGMSGTIIVAAVANQPPTLAITNPVSGALFIAPANVTIQTTVTNGTGSVTNVQFRVGSTILTNKAAAPFSATTNNLPAGTYTLTAIAMDNLGLTATNSVNITVDAPPIVTITNPVSGTVLSAPANVAIKATASATDGTVTNVQFLVGSTFLSNAAAAPFAAVTNNLAAGSYTLSAIASDNHGVTATNSVAISVVTPVAVSLANSAKLSPGNFQFSYAANIGLSYVVQWSTNLAAPHWIAILTNKAASNPVVFVDDHATNNPGFYRVGRLPNP